MKEITEKIVALCDAIKADAANETKASHARIRKCTLELEKLGKEYRKLSIEADKK